MLRGPVGILLRSEEQWHRKASGNVTNVVVEQNALCSNFHPGGMNNLGSVRQVRNQPSTTI